MAMTINPSSDLVINRHNLVKTRSDFENPAALVKAEGNSSAQVSGKKAGDSVKLSSATENIASAGSRLVDFDQAQETMAMLKNNIHKQAGPLLQAQANISSATASSLLED